ncbi:hypothetical protein DBR32_15000 [Taibaiella sp. KBW10]|uniref:LamG-like jellyroll fold domain-containing protein n=1 Tax=Taibaiella sp. KBW10 TaxID=2153357 RepID=UPI000F59F841|nr:LamG-like jellyroll fold domain-containing protein [Taibaiella sp. KBW10]RQO29881.1 hypothetical protein DBR32_15000 [Taibaiella sp. KBW10]
MKTLLYFKRHLLQLCCLALLSVTGTVAYAQGASKAIRFDGTAQVNMGDSLSKSIAQSDFTIELWIKIRSNASDPVFLGNKNWASGSNTGMAWCRYATNTLRFNFRAEGRSRKDYNMILDYEKWNHIAITVKRNGTITGYVNGVQNGTPISIAADSGYTLHANLPFRIGADGNAAFPIDGDMDELKIWNTVRTPSDIRNSMCKKIAGTESGLLAYYRMDEATGTTVTNQAATSTGFFNGTFVNTPLRIASGAAIGDEAVNFYGASFAGQVLNLSSAANGNVLVNNISNSAVGVHLYKVNAVPNTTTGISNPGTNNVYYGVFPVVDTASYALVYDYTNFPAANTFEGGIDLFQRYGIDSTWMLWTALKNTTNNTLSKQAITARKELIIGSFVTSLTCNTPSALNAQNISTNSAVLGWTTGGSNRWNISYGTGAFVPGAGGITVQNISTGNYLLNNLQSNTSYQFYVQDTCASILGASAWAGPYTFTTAIDYSTYGSGYAMRFQGTAANEHVNLGDSLSGAMGTTDLTLETWIKFNNPSSDPSFIGNKNWANGQNTGILWCWNGGNSLRFNFKPVGGTRRDYDITVPDPSEWNHIAMVIDRRGNLTAYLNGVPAGSPINISADSGKTIDGTLPIRLGQDGTGVYGPKFKGAMDELKIWRKALSAAEIRANMCQKVNGADTNLLAYYRMDEPAGNVLTNLAGTGTVFNGTLLNSPQRIVSGAAIGDTSINIYPASWNNVGLSLNSNAMGQLSVDTVEANATGLHLYRMNNAPNYTNGIVQPGGTNQYFGVFTAGNKTASYKMAYHYGTYPNAVANNANLHVYNRKANDDTLWIQTPAVHTVATSILHIQQPLGVKHFVLADFSTPICATPQNVSIGNVDTGAATISWTSTAAGHTIEYGNSSFTLGSGTQVYPANSPMTLTNLNAAQTYKFYIKDSCNATNSSAWVGPFYFATLNTCPQPYNITADSITDASLLVKWQDNGVVTQDYIVSWGNQGFGNPAFGIQTNVTQKRYELTSAAPNTAYDFYIRANCNSSVPNSGWAGPFTFTTLACNPAQNIVMSNVTATGAKASWSSTASRWNVVYGTAGFPLGSGTQVGPLSTAEYTFGGLSNNTDYEFYLQDSCTLGLNPWKGPYAFRTAAPNAINNVAAAHFKLYPNPAADQLQIKLKEAKASVIVIRNNMGIVVLETRTQKEQVTIATDALPSGMYFVTISNESTSGTQKLIIQH